MTIKVQTTGDECAYDNMENYGGYTIATKLPNCLDGLKFIGRRILLCLHRKPDLQKETTLAGAVMELHPHGDASIIAAIATMSQPFTHKIPLVKSDSNFGTYDGDAPAGGRYVDVCEADEARDLFFADLSSNMYKMVQSESELDMEPAYLIPRIPTTLLIRSFGITVGFQTNTMTLGVSELCKLTKEYIRLRNSDMQWQEHQKRLVKYMIPDFPTDCRILNSRQLVKAYGRGDFAYPVVIDGSMSMTSDTIIISTLPPYKPYGDITFEFGSKIKEKGWESQTFQEIGRFTDKKQGVMRGNFKCIVRRGANPFDALATLKAKLGFRMNWKPIETFVDSDGKMSSETPFTLLDKWYTCRRAAVLGDLKQTLQKKVDRKRQLLALIIVADHAKEVADLFINAKGPEDTIEPLATRFGMTRYQAQYLSDLTMAQLTARGRDELLQDLEKLKKEMEELNDKFTHLTDIMIEQVDKFEQSYAKRYPRSAIIPDYIGTACYKGNGFMMLERLEEMDEFLKAFPDAESVDFELFPKNSGTPVAIGSAEDYEGDVPKYIQASYVTPLAGEKYTCCVRKDGGAHVVAGIVPKADVHSQAIPVRNKFTVITKHGTRELIEVSEKIMRKSADVTPTMKDVVYASPVDTEECIVIHASSARPNYLVLERVKGNAKLMRIVVGTWRILGVLPVTDDPVMVNIPKECRNRCLTRHVLFENLASTLQPGQRTGFVFGKTANTWENKFTGVVWRRKSNIILAKPL